MLDLGDALSAVARKKVLTGLRIREANRAGESPGILRRPGSFASAAYRESGQRALRGRNTPPDSAIEDTSPRMATNCVL